ncbi:MAG: phage tail sheath family protein [Streptosporangiales bacterium]|nr:phage tail sheath family protein [Streptosporangiales bacterium]
MPTYLSPGVYVEEVDSGSRPIEGVGTAVAAFLGFAEKGAYNTPILVTNWTQFVQEFGEFTDGSYLAHSVYGYFMNGGGRCYVVRLPRGGGNGQKPKELASGGGAELGGYKVKALGSAKNKSYTVEVAEVDGADGGDGGNPPPDDAFKLVIKEGDRVVEEHSPVTASKGDQNVVTVVNARSKVIRLEEKTVGGELEKPSGSVTVGRPTASPAPSQRQNPDEYVGDASQRTGLGGLEAVDEITMLAIPDLMGAYERGEIDDGGAKAVQAALITHCELMGDRVAILDTPPSLNAQQMKQWRGTTTGYDSKYAAMYWPWISVLDPMSGENVFVPPSGHMAGIWARNDDTRGVHKAPANEVIRGALAVELQITKPEHDGLNPDGINCIRAFPGRGIRVWGARTLSSDPAWRYLNVRRLFNYLEESILSGTQWVVFEPNDHALWAKIRRTIESFLLMEWRKGALFGLTPSQAFYVKCDDETNPPEGIDAGQVVCEVGVAPVKPAEFVIFRLAQISGGGGEVNEGE